MALALAPALAACPGRGAERAPPPPPATRAAVLPAPAPASEPSDACADVGELRVCWDGAAIHAAPRPVPGVPSPSPMGWRCAGRGDARTCRARTASAPGFSCGGARCEQLHPRMPDDGEWQCADSGGVTVCMGGERAAGVAAAPADSSWLCGPRRGGGGADRDGGGDAGERVCVDLGPDFPDGRMTGWRCTTSYEPPPIRRVCDRDPGARTLGERCDARRLCLDGSLCADGWCVPARPSPACWLESDCAPGRGRCRFGSCVEGT